VCGAEDRDRGRVGGSQGAEEEAIGAEAGPVDAAKQLLQNGAAAQRNLPKAGSWGLQTESMSAQEILIYPLVLQAVMALRRWGSSWRLVSFCACVRVCVCVCALVNTCILHRHIAMLSGACCW